MLNKCLLYFTSLGVVCEVIVMATPGHQCSHKPCHWRSVSHHCELQLDLLCNQRTHNSLLPPSLFPPSLQLLYPVVLKDLFIPSFLLVWPARQAFSVAFVQYMQRKITRVPNTFRHKTIHLFLFLAAFIFTW